MKHLFRLSLGILLALMILTATATAQTAETEPNNDCTTANLIAANGIYTGALDLNNGDPTDWFYFQGTNSQVTITMGVSGTTTDYFYDIVEVSGTKCGFVTSTIAHDKIFSDNQNTFVFSTSLSRFYIIKIKEIPFDVPPYNYTIGVSGLVTIPPLTPGGLTNGPTIWFETSKGVVTDANGGVDTWSNSGSIAFDVNTTTTNKPFSPNTRNTHPSLYFNNAMKSTIMTGVIPSDPLGLDAGKVVGTHFIVFDDLTANDNILYALYDNNNVLRLSATAATGTYTQTGYSTPLTTPLPANGISRLINFAATTNASSSTVELQLDGNTATGTTSGSFLSSLSSGGLFTLTGDGAGINRANTSFYEIITYPYILTATEKQRVQSYLAIKYGISLGGNSNAVNYVTTGGTVFWTGNATYKYDVFGIGTDYATGIAQNKGGSTNSSTLSEVGESGKGHNILSNASSMDDGDFLMIGHDNGALSPQQFTNLPPSAHNARFARQWKVQRTNDVGTVKLEFYFNGITFPVTVGGTTNDWYILIDADGDGDFTNATAIHPSAIEFSPYAKLTFNGLSLPDGALYTFSMDLPGVTPPAYPGGVTGSNLWYKSDAGVTTGATLTWANQGSLSGADASQSTAASQPALINSGSSQINFNPVLQFDGSNDFLSTPVIADVLGTSAGSEVGSQFAVYRRISDTQNNNNGVYRFGGNRVSLGNANGMRQQNVARYKGTLAANEVALIDMIASTSAASSTLDYQKNGNGSGVLSQDPYINSPTNTNFYIGGESASTLNANIDVAEIVLYPTQLSAADRRKVQSYLAIKYGISLGDNATAEEYTSSSGAIVWAANNTYKYDIFGIGKDDAGNLNQTQSNSINTGSGDGTGQSGKGNIVLSNPSSLDDGDFLIIGHNNAALTETAPGVGLPASFNNSRRLTRTWWTQHTGDAGAVSLSINLSGLTVSGTVASSFRLLVDADSDGNLATGQPQVYAADNYTGNIVSFSNLVLPNNHAFALVTSATTPAGANENLWLEANSGLTVSGSNVTGWTDQSNHNVFTVTGTPTKVTNALNFNPVVAFNNTGAASALPTNRLTGNTPITTVSAIAVMRSTTNTSTLLGSSVTGPQFGPAYFGYRGDDNQSAGNGQNNRFKSFANTLRTNFSIAFTDISAAPGTYSLNGATGGLTAAGGPFTSIPLTPMIGGTNNNGNAAGFAPFNGEVAEVITFATAPTAQQRQNIESYLAVKYGIQKVGNYFRSDNTVIWDATANAAYTNDVFGIGKDAGTGLNQPASNSYNTGSGDGTGQSGKGNIVLSNASSLDNNDFLLIGHDNAGLTEQTTEVPTAGQKRIAREWRVKRTSDPGTVNLSFDILGLTLTGTTAADFKLLLDADGDFSSGATVVDAASLIGTKVAFAGITIADGSYFTVVTSVRPQLGPGVLGANLWVKANDGATNSGANLTGWTDKTGTNTFTKVGTIGFASNSINFNPAVIFNNTDLNTSQPSNRLDGSTSITYVDGFAVYKKQNGTSGGAVIGSTSPNSNYGAAIFGGESANDSWVGIGISNTYSSFSTTGFAQGFGLVNWDVSLVSSPYAAARYNGLAQSVTAGSGGDYTQISFTPRIGGTNNSGSTPSDGWKHFQGEIAEVVLYPNSLSSADKGKVESYLSIKYGITLDPSVGNYVNSSGVSIWNNTAYWHDVFGIGKDDGSGLNQSSSNSVNTGSGDGTGQSGKGNIVLSNPSSLDNGDFLLIGHDNGALAEQESDLPLVLQAPGVKRLGREWKVKHTGNVGTVSLKVDLSGLSLTGVDINDYAILIDTDGDGDFTTGMPVFREPDVPTLPVLIWNDLVLPEGSVFTFITNSVNSILPVQLTSFEASMNECEARLQWKTAQEVDMQRYVVEINDGGSWKQVQTIAARNDGQPHQYGATVATPAGKVVYARLALVHKDGSLSYSRTIALRCRQAITYSVFPNPASSTIQISGTKAGQRLRIVTAIGGVMQQVPAQQGTTSIKVANLAAATYHVQVWDGKTWQIAGKFVKQ